MRRHRYGQDARRFARKSGNPPHVGESIERLTESSRFDWFVAIGLCILGVLIGHAQTQARGQAKLDPVSDLIQAAINPGTKVADRNFQGIQDFWTGVTSAGDLKRENDRLKSIAAAAENYSDIERLLTATIDELRTELNAPVYGRKAIRAEIIAYFPFDNRLTISAGKKHGIEDQLPVVTSHGLIGIVSTVDETTSQVTLITAPTTRVGALLLSSTPVAGLTRGETSNRLVLDIVENVVVKPGDKVLTSGYGKFTPRGIPIGEVTEVVLDPDYGTMRAFVFPYARVAISQSVAVLK